MDLRELKNKIDCLFDNMIARQERFDTNDIYERSVRYQDDLGHHDNAIGAAYRQGAYDQQVYDSDFYERLYGKR